MVSKVEDEGVNDSLSSQDNQHCLSGCFDPHSTTSAKNEWLNGMLDCTPLAIAIVDRDMRYLAVSRSWMTVFHWENRDIIGKSHFETFPNITNEDKETLRRCLAGENKENGSASIFLETHTGDRIRWKVNPWYDSPQTIGGIVLWAEAISQSESGLASLPDWNLHKTILNTIDALVVVLDMDGRIVQFNKLCEETTGYTFEEVHQRTLWDIFLQIEDIDRIKNQFQELRNGQSSHSTEMIWITKNGVQRTLRWTNTLLPDNNCNRPSFIIGTGFDVTETKKADRTLRKLAFHDSLTQLPNLALFRDRLTVAISNANRQKHQLAVLFLDLNHFKNVNDALGHYGGDRILHEVGQRMLQTIRESDTLARMSGDEFLVLLPCIHDSSQVEQAVQRVFSCFAKPFVYKDNEFHISASIGISLYPTDGIDEETLLKNADSAKYYAKKQNLGHCFYESFMNTASLEQLKLEKAFRDSLKNEDFILHFQPQLNLETNQIAGVETLVRWQHPELGIILPNHFIPFAEESGLIVPLSEWILEKACAQNKEWQDRGFPPIRIAVNISPLHFKQPDFSQKVISILEKTHLDPRWLELELTERVLMDDLYEVRKTLHDLKSIGVAFSIDDFGTGYSSLNYLKRLPIHKLKIDRTFVKDIPNDTSDSTLSRAIIAMAHSLGLTVIAEGVETEEQRDFLRFHQCNEIQGYLFSPPLPAWELEPILSAYKS